MGHFCGQIRLLPVPLTVPSSFLPTMELFLTHWASVDALVGALTPLRVGLLPAVGGVPVLLGRADLEQLKADLTTARGAVTVESVMLSVRRGTVRDQMAAVLGRYEGYAYARALPGAPCVGDAPETFLKPAEGCPVFTSRWR